MRYHKLLRESYVDGPGRRAVLFAQGCSLGCAGCQNAHLWPAGGGSTDAPLDLARRLLAFNSEAVTISGGEPFQQARSLLSLLDHLRALAPAVHIIVYTGYRWEELFDLYPIDLLLLIFQAVDVLVDGRFVAGEDSSLMQYRGSANQRAIDTQATLRSGELAVLDWDTAELILTPDGQALAALGVPDMLGLAGDGAANIRRCGQTKG